MGRPQIGLGDSQRLIASTVSRSHAPFGKRIERTGKLRKRSGLLCLIRFGGLFPVNSAGRSLVDASAARVPLHSPITTLPPGCLGTGQRLC